MRTRGTARGRAAAAARPATAAASPGTKSASVINNAVSLVQAQGGKPGRAARTAVSDWPVPAGQGR